MPFTDAFRDGAVVAALATCLVMGTLRANPRLLMRHYPQALRDAVPSATKAERWAGLAVGLVLIGLLIGGPFLSAHIKLVAEGPLPRSVLFIHAFIVGMVFNAVDWLVLDELWLGVLRPRWAMLPGAEDVPFKFNHLQHARGFVVGTLAAAIIAAAVANLVH